MAVVVIFDIQQPPLGEREIAVNRHQFEKVEGITAMSLATQALKNFMSVSFHDEDRDVLWGDTWGKDEVREVSFYDGETEIKGSINI